MCVCVIHPRSNHKLVMNVYVCACVCLRQGCGYICVGTEFLCGRMGGSICDWGGLGIDAS